MRTPEQIEALVPVSDRSAQRFPRLHETEAHGREAVRRGTDPQLRAGLHGDPAGALTSATARNNASGELAQVPVRQVFLFVGADA